MCNLCKRVVIELLWAVNNIIFAPYLMYIPRMGHVIVFCANRILGRALCQGEKARFAEKNPGRYRLQV